MLTPATPPVVTSGYGTPNLVWHRQQVSRQLADMRREFGAERFEQFWKSAEPPALAFQSAAGMPLGKWAHTWMLREHGTTVGAKVPAANAALGLLLAVLSAAASIVVVDGRMRRRA